MTLGLRGSLETALLAHQRGELEGAAQIYRRLLLEEPANADALHLLGVISLQQADAARAVELIGRAVAVNPSVAAFHANLAEAYRKLGQLGRARGCCRTALRLQPTCAEAANNLGLILLAEGKADEAIAQFEAALQLQPASAMMCNNLGEAWRQKQAPERAIAWFRTAIERDPNLPQAHSNLGQLLLQNGEIDAAHAHCRAAVRLQPNCAEAHNNLGNVLRTQGQLADARACYAEALRLRPDEALTCSNMGQTLQQEGRLADAARWYEQAVHLAPDVARPRYHLGTAYEEMEDLARAGAQYETAVRLDPEFAEAHNALGWVRHEEGRSADALYHYQIALRLMPEMPGALCNLGLLRLEQGDFRAAEDAFRTVLSRQPRYCPAYVQLAGLLRDRLPAAVEQAMRQLLADTAVPPVGRQQLHFGLATVCDARAAYAEAAEHLRAGNALALAERRRRGQGYDPVVHAQFAAGLRAVFSPAFFQRVCGLGLQTAQAARPVFIVGLPRSGTTLTEQILAAHAQVYGAGEQRFGRLDFEALIETGSDVDRFAALERLDRPTIERIGRRHLERLDALNATAPRVVDKMPDNYLFLGLLAALFPNAQFIHCRRDLRDVAVSCWMTSFRNITWANDLDHIATRFTEYLRLMEHWRRVLPVRVLEVDYEETVADLEAVARRLVSWCGLEWDPACLAFHRGKRPVRTASLTQVRQPIYRHAVARWKNYEPVLGELFGRLASLEAPAASPNAA